MRWTTSAFASASLALAVAAPAQALAADFALARDILRELVAVRTVHPDGDNTAAARVVERRLLAAGFDPADVRVVEPAPLKGNLVARLRGTGEAKPMLLLAHIDVVDARREDWSEGLDPWTLTEREGWLYGRGTLDDKGAAAIFAATMIELKRSGFRPKRDIILALTSDEETGTHNGVAILLKQHRALIDAEFAINEGGCGGLRNGKPAMLGVQVSEKRPLTFEIEATNRGGHSSLPRSDNAIYELAAALVRIGAMELPARVGPVARAAAGSIEQPQSGARGAALRAIAAGNPTPEDLRLASSASPSMNAQLRTTCVATRLDAGHADNALPQRAKATVNCRLLPGEEQAFVQGELEKAAGPGMTVRPKHRLPSGPETDPGSPVIAVIQREAAAQWPGMVAIPVMSAGATDGSTLRGAGIPVFGVTPYFMDTADWARMHGRDERIPAKGFGEALEFFGRLVRALSSGT